MDLPQEPSGAASSEVPGIKTPDQRLRVFVSSADLAGETPR